jgi:uncharacterized NAD(P)/FAD-binding protein YdhS
MKTVAIIGGGFSGTLTAVNLARRAKEPLRIVVINHGYPLGRGVAYSTKRAEHLLNVAARNMSAFPDQPNHFLDWLGTRSEYADVPEGVLREQFVPRKIYGDYLQALLFWHGKGDAFARVRIDSVQGEVLDVVPGAGRIAVVVEGQPTIEADKVVLATGNQAPADLPLPEGQFEHPRYLASPWEITADQLTDRHANVVLIGAGLTMIDVFLTLSALDWQGTIYAVSRTSLLPLPHFHGIAYPDFPPAEPTTLGLSGLASLMEDHCRLLRERGENPAIVVDKLRPFTQRIWQSFTVEEKSRFCRDYRTRWNVTRHRIPQSIHERLTSALAAGKLQLVQGRISGMSSSGDRLQIVVGTSSSASGRTTLEPGWVINCTGPQESYKTSKASLYQNLFDRGLVQADELDMGIKVEPNFRVIDGGGYASEFLFALGPMLKGSLWETTAVPELRGQALRVAETILAALEGGTSPDWFAEMWVDVVEYVI